MNESDEVTCTEEENQTESDASESLVVLGKASSATEGNFWGIMTDPQGGFRGNG